MKSAITVIRTKKNTIESKHEPFKKQNFDLPSIMSQEEAKDSFQTPLWRSAMCSDLNVAASRRRAAQAGKGESSAL